MASSRVYFGKIHPDTQKADVEDLFKSHIRALDVKILGGYGFAEFPGPDDAEEIIKKFDGAELLGERIVVQPARGEKPREQRDPYGRFAPPGPYGKPAPRLRRGQYRVIISNLPPKTSWQDLKDIGREAGQISFADVDPVRPDEGVLEYQNKEDMERALDKIEGLDLRGNKLRADPGPAHPPSPPPRNDYRSGGYGGGGGGGYGPGRYDDYQGYPPRGAYPPRDYDMRGPPPGRYGGGGGYDSRGPPPPRDYDSYGRPPPRDYGRDRDYGRGPPPPSSSRRYDDEQPSSRGPARERELSPRPRRDEREYSSSRRRDDERDAGGEGAAPARSSRSPLARRLDRD